MLERIPIRGELISVVSANGYRLDGILYHNPDYYTTIVNIHGSYGNFYQNSFVRLMALRYMEAGINFLSINTLCHDGLSEGYHYIDEFEYTGGGISKFSQCLPDIQGAITYSKEFSNRIVLQGHSLGCDRILHYLIERDESYDFILLAPCDSYELHTRWIAPESVDDQIKRLRSQPQRDPYFDWLPTAEYGIRAGEDWTYPIPITRNALLSIIDGPPFRLMRLSDPARFHLNQRALVYIGGKDALQVCDSKQMFKYLEDRIGHLTSVYIPQGDHMLGNCEEAVIGSIISWVRNIE